jgi:uncharacterized membrane protein (UPF0127 family)
MPVLIRTLLLLIFIIAHHSAWAADITTLKIGSKTVRAEIADTEQSREHGLMERDHLLCTDCGMLFVFDYPGRHGFWMMNTQIPLSIAFIAADGRILNIEEMQANTVDPHYPQGEALYALEMKSGWFTRNNIAPASQVGGLPR